MRATLFAFALCSLFVAPVVSAQEAEGESPEQTLLILGFKGSNAKLIKEVAARIEAEYGLKTEVLTAAPKPSKDGIRDNREKTLRPLAQQVGVTVGKRPNWKKVEAQCRKALKKMGTPQAKSVLDYLDIALMPQYSVETLAKQAADVAGERLQAPGVQGVLAVTDEDVTSPDVNFLFGWVNGELRAGIMSYARFQPGANKKVLIKRAAKQALSSTGFVLGIARCKTKDCARAYPASLEEHDAKSDSMCAACRGNVEKRKPR